MLALSLRLFHLSEQELWFDEVLSIHRATVDERMLEVLRSDDTPPFYYLLLRFWLSAGGTSEVFVRLPSAVVGTLCVLAVIWAGQQMFSPAAGLRAGAFVTVSPIHIYYSQEARTYALLTLELALAYGLAWRATRLFSPLHGHAMKPAPHAEDDSSSPRLSRCSSGRPGFASLFTPIPMS